MGCGSNGLFFDLAAGAEILLRIAHEFGRTMEWLLTEEDRP